MLFGKVILGKNLFFLFYKEMIIMIEGYLVQYVDILWRVFMINFYDYYNLKKIFMIYNLFLEVQYDYEERKFIESIFD